MDFKAVQELATRHADAADTDYVFYNGPVYRPYDSFVIEAVRKAKRRKNVVLIICTTGGDADAAYRIARCLQQRYEKLTVIVGGQCKSAGTLLATGAHDLVISENGEFGPLDVQLGKKDEIWELDSGLTVLTAIGALEEKCFSLFENAFLSLKARSQGRITLKTATEIASNLAVGTIAPIVSQIDPMHVGEVSRAMNIGLEYGRRLNKVSKNAKTANDPADDALQRLTNGYPSHGFVIDLEEAKTLFHRVRTTTDQEQELLDTMEQMARTPNQSNPLFIYLSKSPQEVAANEASNKGNAAGGAKEAPERPRRGQETGGNGGAGQAAVKEAPSKREKPAAS